ncbi:MAG: asparagine--tRNA ligase [Treponemataceae bacterium]|nr:MAG: asparagine--tRNA ligase [Treponemataceae bacterium]
MPYSIDMKTKLISEIFLLPPQNQAVELSGWVRTKRDSKNLVFLAINDGSCFDSIQLTFDRNSETLSADDKTQIENALKDISTGASVNAVGLLVPSPASGQAVEISVTALRVLGRANAETYPLQKKGHTFEFLREIAHLRARGNTFGAVARVRSQMSLAVHTFFQERGFQYFTAPLITASDCEGAGEMFQVTTLDLAQIAKSNSTQINYDKDFFGKKAYLTVSGQLAGETYATALSRIYTFGPTFRAENSNTVRHLAEFWMIEPEMSFFDLADNMDLAEEFVKYLIDWALTKCTADIAFFDERIKKGLIAMLQNVVKSDFKRITYTDAVAELEAAAEKGEAKFEYKPFWGCDLQSEHERYLTESRYKKPVIVTDYPKEIKAFYMKLNDDGKTVRAMDVLVPGLGEIIGGAQREEDYDKLVTRMNESGLNPDDYWWYLDLRKYGTVPHSGFGLGFERLLLYVTGMTNIRDVIPYPRTPKSAEF